MNPVVHLVVEVRAVLPDVLAEMHHAELAQDGVNVATGRLSRNRPGGVALHLYELDEKPEAEAVRRLGALPAVQTGATMSP